MQIPHERQFTCRRRMYCTTNTNPITDSVTDGVIIKTKQKNTCWLRARGRGDDWCHQHKLVINNEEDDSDWLHHVISIISNRFWWILPSTPTSVTLCYRAAAVVFTHSKLLGFFVFAFDGVNTNLFKYITPKHVLNISWGPVNKHQAVKLSSTDTSLWNLVSLSTRLSTSSTYTSASVG